MDENKTSDKKNTLNIGLVLILAVGAAVIGYLAYSVYSQPAGDSEGEAPEAPTPPTQTDIDKEDILKYTWDGSEEEKSRYFDALVALGVRTSEISIAEGCAINPELAKIDSTAINIKNTDIIDHTLVREEWTEIIPAGATKVVELSFIDIESGGGFWGYRCTNAPPGARIAGGFIFQQDTGL